MIYHSLKNPDIKASFSKALLSSLAPDGGLYMPESIPRFEKKDLARLGAVSFADCASYLARFFVDDQFTDEAIASICQDAYDFPLPLMTLAGDELDTAMVEPGNEYILELIHGPTLAFKDFAARFMGRAASHLMSESGEKRTILVATSGDTGGAIGHAFLNQPGVTVFILFPNGGVSSVQEHQLTSMGRNSNVKAIGVDGSFDDCQALVKQAFSDEELSEKHSLMSANSINVGRVIPQSFYYFWTSLQAKAAFPDRPIVYSIPSGNLGNLTGGLIARKMGAPIDQFVVGNNINHPFIDYLSTGEYIPRNSVPTLSNAMDIGRPNNFPRILELFNDDHAQISAVCRGWYFGDDQTERHMRKIYNNTGYIMCPHTAVGHLAMNKFEETADREYTKITVSTAHPAKFLDDVERILREDLELPASLQASVDAPSHKHIMAPNIDALRTYLDAEA
ncbi:MAG: threonine synthase [Acidimicrobiales bacterium]|nr:threonine synthase [Hyphomonadaceae bacterium]RZV34449.1 MAG: threonine synthase [Acidimicrobiales bacterium]